MITFNGKKIASGAQLGREFEKSIYDALEKNLKQRAPANVQIKRDKNGFVATGSQAAIEKFASELKE